MYNRQRNLARYAKLRVFERITGKSVFKDYNVLLEKYETKQMQQIWIYSHIHMLRKKDHFGFNKAGGPIEATEVKDFKELVNKSVNEKAEGKFGLTLSLIKITCVDE